MFEQLNKVTQSYSVAFADFVRAKEREGRLIAKMQTGEPDFPTHPSICEAAYNAMLDGETRYCDSRGLLSLREAIAEKLLYKNGIKSSASQEVLVTHGAVHALSMAIRTIINPSDECIILEPYWRAYEMDVILASGIPVIHKNEQSSGFQLDANAVLQRISPRTKAIIINSPNNPSGAVYSRKELIKLVNGAAERGVYVISDEVYESIIFDNFEHYSIASDSNVADWVISAFSFSKTYAMTGWRLGYLVASARIISEILKLSQFSITSISPFAQLAALYALKNPDVDKYVEMMRSRYFERRSMISDLIKGTRLEEKVLLPNGTFYALIDLSELETPSLEMAKQLVEVSNIALTPGIAFGDNMDGYLRMCFAASDENIRSSITALKEFYS